MMAHATALRVHAPLPGAHAQRRAGPAGTGRPGAPARRVTCQASEDATRSAPARSTVSAHRRSLCLAAVAAALIPALPASASSTLAFTEPSDITDNPALQRGLSKYIKRKQLEPIEYYVPPVLLAQEQLALVGPIALAEDAPPNAFKGARQLLRVGPFTSFRDNCRRIGEFLYLQDRDSKDIVEVAVTDIITKVDALDSKLLVAGRDGGVGPGTGADVAAAATAAGDAISSLLALLPEDVLDKSRAIAASANESGGVEFSAAPAPFVLGGKDKDKEESKGGSGEASGEASGAGAGGAEDGASTKGLKSLEGLL